MRYLREALILIEKGQDKKSEKAVEEVCWDLGWKANFKNSILGESMASSDQVNYLWAG